MSAILSVHGQYHRMVFAKTTEKRDLDEIFPLNDFGTFQSLENLMWIR